MHVPAHNPALLSPTQAGCSICGARDAEPTVMLDFPRQAHVVCMDWCSRPFFFAHQLQALRRLWKTAPESRPVVAPLGRELAALQARWAPPGAEVLRMHQRIRAAVTQLRGIGIQARAMRGL